MTEQNGLKRQEGVSGGDLKKKKKRWGKTVPCPLSSWSRGQPESIPLLIALV